MSKVYHTKLFSFNAQHSLNSTNLKSKENIEVFGKCVRPHGHDYILKVTVSGTPNKKTNKLLIEREFEEKITEFLERFNYQDLNSLHEFSFSQIPTSENIIKVFYYRIRSIIEELQNGEYCDEVDLAFLELQETNKNRFLYFGERNPSEVEIDASNA